MEKFLNVKNKIDVKFKKLHEDAVIPKFSKPFDSGFDLRSVEDTMLIPGKIVCVHTGLSVELPDPKYTHPFVLEMQIRPRSGLAAKYGISVLNTPGTIDNQYRGELIIIMINQNPQFIKDTTYGVNGMVRESNEVYRINKGDRIAQAVIVPVLSTNILNIVEVDDINKTVRGSNGFGSTGIN